MFLSAGNPGTGKTTFAEMYAKLLYALRMSNGKYYEISGNDLQSTYSHNSGARTRQILQDLCGSDDQPGGVLFIDEA